MGKQKPWKNSWESKGTLTTQLARPSRASLSAFFWAGLFHRMFFQFKCIYIDVPPSQLENISKFSRKLSILQFWSKHLSHTQKGPPKNPSTSNPTHLFPPPDFHGERPGFLSQGILILQELGNLLPQFRWNVVLCQVAPQKSKFRVFIFLDAAKNHRTGDWKEGVVGFCFVFWAIFGVFWEGSSREIGHMEVAVTGVHLSSIKRILAPKVFNKFQVLSVAC